MIRARVFNFSEGVIPRSLLRLLESGTQYPACLQRGSLLTMPQPCRQKCSIHVGFIKKGVCFSYTRFGKISQSSGLIIIRYLHPEVVTGFV